MRKQPSAAVHAWLLVPPALWRSRLFVMLLVTGIVSALLIAMHHASGFGGTSAHRFPLLNNSGGLVLAVTDCQ